MGRDPRPKQRIIQHELPTRGKKWYQMNNRLQANGAQLVGRPVKIGKYEFCPRNCVRGTERDFQVTLYSDQTLVWDDRTMRIRVIGAEEGFLKAIFDNEDEKPSELERPYFVRTKASVGVASMFVRIRVIKSGGKHLAAKTVVPLDDHLEEIFWPEVNPQLPDPLTRRTTGRKPTK